MVSRTDEVATTIVGSVANVLILTVYFSPLQNAYTVIRRRDASSLYLPWSVLQLVNNTLWTVNGLCIWVRPCPMYLK
jgi:hypothetical protein